MLLLLDAEALLLVDHDEAEVVEAHLGRQHGVRADHYVRRAGDQPFAHAFLGGPADEPAHRLYAHRRAVEAREERLVVLLGEDGGGGQHYGLPAVHGRDEGRAHGDLRLAVAGVAADEAVHGPGARHVALDVGYGLILVRRLLVGEGGLELRYALGLDVEGEARNHRTAGLRLEKGGCEVLHGAAGVLLVLGPSAPVEAVQLRLLALDAHVAREEVGVRGGHVQKRSVGVLDREHLAPPARDVDLRRALEYPDAVVQMHHEIARFEVEVAREALSGRGGRRGARRLAPVREHPVALRDDDEARHLESAAHLLVLHHERTLLLGGDEVRLQSRAGGVDQLWAARGLDAQLGEARKGRRLER